LFWLLSVAKRTLKLLISRSKTLSQWPMMTSLKTLTTSTLVRVTNLITLLHVDFKKSLKEMLMAKIAAILGKETRTIMILQSITLQSIILLSIILQFIILQCATLQPKTHLSVTLQPRILQFVTLQPKTLLSVTLQLRTHLHVTLQLKTLLAMEETSLTSGAILIRNLTIATRRATTDV
jgi:hypothetical protein